MVEPVVDTLNRNRDYEAADGQRLLGQRMDLLLECDDAVAFLVGDGDVDLRRTDVDVAGEPCCRPSSCSPDETLASRLPVPTA